MSNQIIYAITSQTFPAAPVTSMKEEVALSHAFAAATDTPTSAAVDKISSTNSEILISPSDDAMNGQQNHANGEIVVQNGTITTGEVLTTTPNSKANTKKKSGQNKEKMVADAKINDESCFKTPALPTNKKTTRPSANKRRSKVSADSGKTLCVDQTPNSVVDPSQPMVHYSDQELLREFVSIGKHSFLCPRSQQSLAKRYPGLMLRKSLEDGNQEDMIKEIVIDEFSLLLFRSLDDFNLLKEREDEMKKIEEAQAKQRQHEENLRLGKIKKKGRKSKLEIKREKKEAKRKAHKERKEQRRREREERRQRKATQLQQGTSSSQQQNDHQQHEINKKERRERREARKLEKIEREKRRDEKKRQKQAKKLDEKRHKEKSKVVVVSSPAICTASAAAESVPSTSSAALPQQHVDTSGIARIKIEKLDEENRAPSELKLVKAETPGIGVKRPPSSAIGISAVHQNGLIQSPANNNWLSCMPPTAKMAKLEAGGLEEYGGNRNILIGIAHSGVSDPTNHSAMNPMDRASIFGQQLQDSKDFPRVSASTSSLASSSSQCQALSQQQEQLQQTFFKNPELAYNFQQLANLYSLDPSLMASASFSPGFPFVSQLPNSPTKLAPKFQASMPLNTSSATPSTMMPSFPLGVPLASQLATLAASQSTKLPPGTSSGHQQGIPFKSGRWCNMHAIIAHEIAKHQDAAKKAGRTPSIGIAGRQPSGSGAARRTPQEKKPTTPSQKNNRYNSAVGISGAKLTTHSEHEMRKRSAVGMVATSTPAVASSSLGSSSNTSASLQQHLNLLLAQQQHRPAGQSQQQPLGTTANDQLLTSALLSRLQQSSTNGTKSMHNNESPLFSSSAGTAGNPLNLSLSQLAQLTTAAANSSSAQQQQHQSSLFGGFPIQPPGPGTGSLTSGNSDAAAAAQLQQQAQLLATLQQQQAQLAAMQALPQQQSSLAASLLAQFGVGSASNPLLTMGQPGLPQPQQSLFSALMASSSGASQFGLGHQSAPAYSLDSLHSLPNTTNSLLNSTNETGGAESILAAFLSGQSMEPKMAFPPQLPSSSTSSSSTANSLGGQLSFEQQLLRSQMGTQMNQFAKLSNASAMAPPPSSLIAGTLAGSAGPPMNPIEQELLMRQILVRQQQMGNGIGVGDLGAAIARLQQQNSNDQQQTHKSGGPSELLGGGNTRQQF